MLSEAINCITSPSAIFAEALEKEDFDASRAALATVDGPGQPAVRFVLVRRVDSHGCVFYTDYRSKKAQHLDSNGKASLAWHWSSSGVQVRMEGLTHRVEHELSDEYFSGRPRGSQIGAWASNQSSALDNRADLEEKYTEIEARFNEFPIERPPHWGGYRVVPDRIELWFNRDDRLHDRFEYVRNGSRWLVTRLSP